MSDTCDFPLCNKGVERGGFCISHAKYFAGAKPDKEKKEIKQVSEKKAKAETAKVMTGAASLIDDFDDLISKYVRLRETDENGNLQCFTCPNVFKWTIMQCGHFVPRSALSTRWLLQNLKPQCRNCNEHLAGNLKVFEELLEKETPGIVEFLKEQSRIVTKPEKDELKQQIIDYKQKVKILLKIKK